MGKQTVVVLLLAMLVMVSSAELGTLRGQQLHLNRCKALVNGCTNAGFFRSYEKTFMPACSTHDVCYACGREYRVTRSECDERFFASMVQICKEKKYSACYIHARLYYYGAKLFGGKHYNIWGHHLCARKCVKFLLEV